MYIGENFSSCFANNVQQQIYHFKMFLVFQLFDGTPFLSLSKCISFFLVSITCCFNILGDKNYLSVVSKITSSSICKIRGESEIFSCFLCATLVPFLKASSTKENRLEKSVPFDIQVVSRQNPSGN